MDAYEGVRIRARCARGWYACGAYWVPGVLGAIARLGFPPLTPGLAWVPPGLVGRVGDSAPARECAGCCRVPRPSCWARRGTWELGMGAGVEWHGPRALAILLGVEFGLLGLDPIGYRG